MYFLSKAITEQGIKMVLSGEGADEVFGGYLYFRNAPSAADFQQETIDRVQKLFTADLLRADKSTMAHGLEARVPFLDKEFLELAIKIKPEEKQPKTYQGIEKYILRKAFDTPEKPYLPEEVLWRQKEQFSDGVGYSWIDTLKEKAAEQVTDQQMETAHFRFPYNTPSSKEGYLYREIFEELFPLPSAAECVPGGPSVACSSAKAIEWDESFKSMDDPSGRAVGVHQDAYK